VTATDIKKTLRVFTANSHTELFAMKEKVANRTYVFDLLESVNLMRFDECSPFLSTSFACAIRASPFLPLCVGVQGSKDKNPEWIEELNVETKWSYADEYR
jgi:hypothetical protein